VRWLVFVCYISLEALAVDDAWAAFIVLGLADPHLLEGGQRGQDGAANPDGVLAFWWGNDLDLHRRWSQCRDFLLHAVSNAGEHGRTTRQDSVGIEILADIDVALHDRVESRLVDACSFHSQEGWLEQGLRASEALIANGDHLTIGQFVALFHCGRRGSGLHFVFKVEGDIAELLLDVSDDFSLGGGREGVAALGQDLHQVVGEIATGQVEPHDGMGQSISFVDGDGMSDTITHIQDDAGSTARGVQREDSLNGNIGGRAVERFEEDLDHLLSVGLRVERRFSHQAGVLFWRNSQLVGEGVMPYLLHVIPVGNNSVLDGVLECQDASLRLGFISNVAILLSHTNHDALMARSSNY